MVVLTSEAACACGISRLLWVIHESLAVRIAARRGVSLVLVMKGVDHVVMRVDGQGK